MTEKMKEACITIAVLAAFGIIGVALGFILVSVRDSYG